MGYRDETETLRARVTEVEAELADAQETIGRLTGLVPAAETGSSEERSQLLGAPKVLRLERELDLEVSDAGLEAIAEVLRQRLPGATVSQVGRTLSAPGFTLTQRDGMTQIALVGDYRPALRGIVAGTLVGGPFGAMALLAVVHDTVARLPEAQMLTHLLWVAPLMMMLVFALMRGRIGRSVEARSVELRGTFEAIVELAKRHRVREAPRVRVAADEADEVDEALAAVADADAAREA